MSSSASWPPRDLIESIKRRTSRLLRRMGYVQAIEEALKPSSDRYVDADVLATVLGCSRAAAERELARAVSDGLLESRWIYSGPDAPGDIIVDRSDLGETIRLGDAGFYGEREDEEIVISRMFAREVFVAK